MLEPRQELALAPRSAPRGPALDGVRAEDLDHRRRHETLVPGHVCLVALAAAEQALGAATGGDLISCCERPAGFRCWCRLDDHRPSSSCSRGRRSVVAEPLTPGRGRYT